MSSPSSGQKNKPSHKPAWKRVAKYSSETSVDFLRTITLHYIPEDRTLQIWYWFLRIEEMTLKVEAVCASETSETLSTSTCCKGLWAETIQSLNRRECSQFPTFFPVAMNRVNRRTEPWGSCLRPPLFSDIIRLCEIDVSGRKRPCSITRQFHNNCLEGWPEILCHVTSLIKTWIADRHGESVGVLISLWLFLFPIFLFAAQPKIFLGWVEKVRTTKS
jgi:hypothetical protein